MRAKAKGATGRLNTNDKLFDRAPAKWRTNLRVTTKSIHEKDGCAHATEAEVIPGIGWVVGIAVGTTGAISVADIIATTRDAIVKWARRRRTSVRINAAEVR